MLVWIINWLKGYYRAASVFHYITLRTILAALTAFFFALMVGPAVIRRLKQYKIGQVIRQDGPKAHYGKSGTPTMGGVFLLIAITGATLLWSDLTNGYVWLVLFVMLSFGVIGGVDDYRKLKGNHSKGLTARRKYFWESVLALGVACFLYFGAKTTAETSLLLPFFKNMLFPLGLFYILLTYFVIVGTSNAVNLTDGLDGLAIVPAILISGALGIFAYVTGHVRFAHYLSVPYIPGMQEVTVFCGSLVGAGLGFLWFNAYPAQIFMGDVGSLSLGAALGVIAVLVRQEIVLFIMGGVFVMETLSVILQVGSFKLTGRRLFKMAPLHHHFELSGWVEPKVIVRFWIVTVVLVLGGLATLKLR